LKNRGGSLSGTAENADTGKPMAGEVIIAAPYQAENPDHEITWLKMEHLVRDRLEIYEHVDWFGMDYPRTITDEAGRYEFEHIPGGKYLVCVVPKVMPGGRREGVIVEEDKLTENVTVQATAKPKGFLLLRFVNENGEPLKENFSFEMKGDRFSTNGGISTDEEGRWYRQQNHEAQKANLKITGKGYLSAEKRIELNPAEFQEILITMRKGAAETAEDQAPGTLVGKALMPDGKTAAVGVLVIPFTQDAPSPGSEAGTGRRRFSEGMSVTTDANGAFRIANLEPGEYGVCLWTRTQTVFDAPLARPEFAECVGTLSPLVPLAAGETARLPDVSFAKPARLQIHVLDAETGKPLAKARASFYETPSRGSNTVPFERTHHNAESDEAGLIDISGLRAGEYSVRVGISSLRDGEYSIHNEYDSETRSRVVLKEGQDVSLEFKLRPIHFGDVAGIVRLPDGAPARGAKIFSSGSSQDPTAIADDEGRFLLKRRRVGQRSLYVTHPKFAPAEQEFAIAVGQTHEVVFNLMVGGVLEARVLDGAGNPPGEDVRVVLAFPGRATSSIRSLLNHPRQNVLISSPGDDGRVRFEHLPAWPMTLYVVKDQEALSMRSAIEVAEGKTVELTLSSQKERGIVEGRVAEPDGTPVIDARLKIFGILANGGSRGKIQTDADGRYRAECLPGRWAVAVGEKVLQGRVDVNDGETTIVDFTMGPYGTVSGKVTDVEGRPAVGIRVSTLDKGGDERAFLATLPEFAGVTSAGMAETDQEGRFTLSNLLPGEYKLYVTSHGRRRDDQPAATVRVEAGKDTAADIVLKE